VAEGMMHRLHETGGVFPEEAPLSFWEKMVWIIGMTHDLGKATHYFQTYLKAPEDEKEKFKNKPETHHSLLSALYTFRLTEELLIHHSSEYHGSYAEFLPFFAFWAVKKHHGSLEDPVRDELSTPFYREIPRQIRAMNTDVLAEHLDMCYKKISCPMIQKLLPDPIESWIHETFENQMNQKSIRFKLPRTYPSDEKGYFLMTYFYSLLLYADKNSVIFEHHMPERPDISPTAVQEYKKRTFGRPVKQMDRIRESVYKEALSNAEQVDIHRVKSFSLNIPTGTGKTLTGLATALTFRERIHKTEGYTPRIIYALPFMSIIDQNFQVFQDVFHDPSSRMLLKHHSMADLFYKEKGSDEEYNVNESRFLIESWDSEIIVTTFVQIFHTLLSNNHHSLKKFHKFAGSILILDEVQSIPLKYWGLIRLMLRGMIRYLNTRIIFMTATQPELLTRDEVHELVPRKDHYFSCLNRVTLNFHPETVTLNVLADMLSEDIEKTDDSILVILNTIGETLILFEEMQKRFPGLKKEYLSTNIIPLSRQERIARIRRDPSIRLVITTQLVEAGVDMDMDQVWRDFGPLDTINQAAGRCNRHDMKSQRGKVRIFKITDEKGNFYYKRIYGDNPLGMILTKSIYKNKNEIEEKDFLESISEYYTLIQEGLEHPSGDHFIQSVQSLHYPDIGRFTLIEDTRYYQADLFITVDSTAEAIWQRFCDISIMADPIEKVNALSLIKKDLYRYIISVPYKYVKTKRRGIHVLPLKRVPDHYDSITGFRRTDLFIEEEETLIF
jgi:CRISPR-associated endonuclease/helicase Cas3